MRKTRYLIIILLIGIVLFLIPTVSNATVEVSKNVYSNNGSVKFIFTGLTLDTTHEYEFGLTKTAATAVKNWHLITEYTESTATVNITGGTTEFTDVITAVETGYVTIKDKTTDTVVLEPYAVDLSISYLNITNYTVIGNGKDLYNNNIQVNFWNYGNSTAYYQYEKITDENVINKFKEIKRKNGDYNELSPLLKTTAPTSNWNKWVQWYYSGSGYTQRTVSVPDEGIYYMWIYLAGNNIRDLYGYILVDNLQPEIALDSISLPQTQEVELEKTLTLTPTFNPVTTTNKIVTWTSSDETVATVDNAGKVTPKKIGSTIITVTSQDGNKKAMCTVTVTQSSNAQEQNNNTEAKNTEEPKNEQEIGSQEQNNNPEIKENEEKKVEQKNDNQEIKDNEETKTEQKADNQEIKNNEEKVSSVADKNEDLSSEKPTDSTIAPGKLPYTGVKMEIGIFVIGLVIIGGIAYFKFGRLKGI